jgi:hypothetical protein
VDEVDEAVIAGEAVKLQHSELRPRRLKELLVVSGRIMREGTVLKPEHDAGHVVEVDVIGAWRAKQSCQPDRCQQEEGGEKEGEGCQLCEMEPSDLPERGSGIPGSMHSP